MPEISRGTSCMFSKHKVLPAIMLFFFIICTLASAVGCNLGNTSLPLTRSFDRYKDVPGVTSAEVTAIEELKTSPPLIFGTLEGKESFFTTSGIIGFNAELCKWMSDFFGLKIEPHIYDNYKDIIDGLENGSIDFSGEVSADPESDTVYYIMSSVYNSISIATCRNELKSIISVLQKFVLEDYGVTFQQISESGKRDYLENELINTLSPTEYNYLKMHKNPAAMIPVAIEHDNYPISFYNENENAWQGIAVDVIDKIEDITGMHFDYISNNTDNWVNVFEMLNDESAEMIAELILTKERENNYHWSGTYHTDRYIFLSDANFPDLTLNQITDLRVGIVTDTAHEEVFRELFPNHKKVVNYDSISKSFDGLDKGECDVLMATRNMLLSSTNYFEKVGYKANISLDKTYYSNFGFHKNQSVLASVVGKALLLINTQEISDDWMSRVFDYRGNLARAQVPYLIIFLFFSLIAFGLAIVLLIRKQKSGKELEHLVDVRTKDLEEKTEMANVASKTKSDFLARMSHEIRTPLNAIIGMTEIAKKADSPGKVASSLENITAASGHLLGILNDVLDMSKIESGKFVLTEEAFALKAAMNEVCDIIEQRTGEKNISFVKNLVMPENSGVIGDKLRLKQVLINLLGNSVKFTPNNGIIEFSAITEADDNFIKIAFSVKDTGIGISGEEKNKLFKAFEQANNDISSKFGGTGLGLAISQNLVSKMGGVITVESEVGKGSTFGFEISLKKAQIEEKAVADSLDFDFSGKRILLVEDVEINRLILIDLLSDTKLEIEEAVDGLDAVTKFKASDIGHYDLIFMDIQMPNLDGYGATEAIRALDRSDAKTVHIVAMTANAYKEDIDRAREAGMSEHLSKPIDLEKVLSTLSRRLNQK